MVCLWVGLLGVCYGVPLGRVQRSHLQSRTRRQNNTMYRQCTDTYALSRHNVASINRRCWSRPLRSWRTPPGDDCCPGTFSYTTNINAGKNEKYSEYA